MSVTVASNGDIHFHGNVYFGNCKEVCDSEETKFKGSSDELIGYYEVTETSMTTWGAVKTLAYGCGGIAIGVSTGVPLYIAIGGLTGLLYGLVTSDKKETTKQVEYDDGYDDDFTYHETLGSIGTEHVPNKNIEQEPMGRLEYVKKEVLEEALIELKNNYEQLAQKTINTDRELKALSNMKSNFEKIQIAYRQKELLDQKKIVDTEVI